MIKGKGIRFSWKLRSWFYSIFSLLFLSGILWWCFHYLGMSNESLDEGLAFIKPWLMRIHGASAMASLVLLGFLIPRHMQRGWALNRNRRTGVVLVVWCLILVLSGYGLYYCGDELFRAWLSNVHGAAGTLIPLTLIWHIHTGRSAAKS